MLKFVLLLGLIASPAAAQQIITPSQLALQLNNAIAQMAQQLEALRAENEQLKKELAAKSGKEGK